MGVKGAGQVWDALKSYTERHYRRVEELVEESYLIEYTLREMEEVFSDNAILAGESKDVEMIT